MHLLVSKRKKDEGISPIDLLDLPEQLRLIMRDMLRNITMSFKEIEDNVGKWDGIEIPDGAELLKIMKSLVDQGWVIQLGEEPNFNYRANLRKKKKGTLKDSIWDAISTKVEESEQEKEEDTE